MPTRRRQSYVSHLYPDYDWPDGLPSSPRSTSAEECSTVMRTMTLRDEIPEQNYLPSPQHLSVKSSNSIHMPTPTTQQLKNNMVTNLYCRLKLQDQRYISSNETRNIQYTLSLSVYKDKTSISYTQRVNQAHSGRIIPYMENPLCTLVILKVHILLYRRMLSATIAVCFLVYMFKITYILVMLLVLSLANTPNLLNSMLYCSSSSYMHTTFMNKALSMYITSIIVVRLVECKLNENNYITNCQSITLLNFLLKASTRRHSNSNEWDSNHHPPDFNIILFFALKLIFMQYSAENIPRLRETASHFQFSNFQEKENRLWLSTGTATQAAVSGWAECTFKPCARTEMRILFSTYIKFDSNYEALASLLKSNTKFHGQFSVCSDSDEGGESNSNGNHSTTSNNITRSTSYTTRASIRRSMRNHGSISDHNTDEDGDGDGNEEKNRDKLKSQCEASPTVSFEEERTLELNEPVGLSIDQTLSVSSRLWVYAKSFLSNDTVLNGYANSTEVINNDHMENSACQNFSSLSPILDTSILSAPEKMATPIKNTPDPNTSSLGFLTEILKNRDKDTYFTGTANPLVTPVAKKKAASTFLNIPIFSPKMVRRIRTRSETLNPYEIPPMSRIRDRVKSRLLSQDPDATPLAAPKRRVVSESETSKIDVDDVENTSFQIGDDFFCLRLNEEGFHNILPHNNALHIQKKFFNLRDTCMFNMTALDEAITKVLGEQVLNCEDDTHQSLILPMDSEKIMDLCGNNLVKDLLDPITEQNCLESLLSRLVRHTKKHMSTDCAFNGIQIIRTSNNCQKIPFNDLASHESPLCVLFLENERALNIIPKKLKMTSLSIYDVSVEGSSVLLFHPALLDDMNIYLAEETRPQTCQKLTLIIPCVTNETVPKCPDTEQRHDNPCVKNKESRYNPSFVSSKENEQKPKISKNVHFNPDVTEISNTAGNIPPSSDVDTDVHPLPPNATGNIPQPADVDIEVHPLSHNAAINIPIPADVDTGVHYHTPDTVGNIPPPADVDTGVHPLPLETVGNITSSSYVDTEVHPLPPDTVGSITPPSDVDTEVHPFPTEIVGNIPPPTYVDTEVHPLSPNAAVNIPPPVNVDTEVHPLPPDTIGIITPPSDVDTEVHPFPPETVGNSSSHTYVDIEVHPCHLTLR